MYFFVSENLRLRRLKRGVYMVDLRKCFQMIGHSLILIVKISVNIAVDGLDKDPTDVVSKQIHVSDYHVIGPGSQGEGSAYGT